MVYFFQNSSSQVIALNSFALLSPTEIDRLVWLFSEAKCLGTTSIMGNFIGPKKEIVSPWSTNASDICHNAGVSKVERVEQYQWENDHKGFDPMLQQKYDRLDQNLFSFEKTIEPVFNISNIKSYNTKSGLALGEEEIKYLEQLSKQIERPLTDVEIFGFSQINSEHCRHKIFNGTFIIDGKRQKKSLFQWIKKTSKKNPNFIVSAYKDNVAFIKGPVILQFSPKRHDQADWFRYTRFDSVLSLKAETHNFPTTVEPFNGAATGSGGEIRDRMAGGQGSIPLAGMAVYMTSYPRLENNRSWEKKHRKWLYQTPQEILIKASNGASDYGNKFGQPLICGSVLTFEHEENDKKYGYDKVIMLAGGIGYSKQSQALKKEIINGEIIIVMGGDNYRIGMGGGTVSSVDTGALHQVIELNAVQRSNPEMQKRVANVIRCMVEQDKNPISSIHDHGAGGHLNCLSELVENIGGKIAVYQLPIGDKTMSIKEILGNESQERMGLTIKKKDKETLKNIAKRERAPYYEVGQSTNDHVLTFEDNNKSYPFHLKLKHLFGSSPPTIIKDENQQMTFNKIHYSLENLDAYIDNVLKLEAVACKDWLTNKVDRCVTGKVAQQQTCGELQLPLSNVAVMALDFSSDKGIATSLGHAPLAGLIDPAAGSILSVTEALTNLVWAPLSHGIKGISLSANWMWASKNPGEDARLYTAVQSISEFVCELGINIPTGKDSLSMTQKYPNNEKVYAPGTVIISTIGEVDTLNKTIRPVIDNTRQNSHIIYIDFSGGNFELGGSSFAQTLSKIGDCVPTVDSQILKNAFCAIQHLIKEKLIIAGHDVSSGGLITTLLEMTFANIKGGLSVDISSLPDKDIIKLLFSEKPGIVIQADLGSISSVLEKYQVKYYNLGKLCDERKIKLFHKKWLHNIDIDLARSQWYKTSLLMDENQNNPKLAQKRHKNKFCQPLFYDFSKTFSRDTISQSLDCYRTKRSNIKAAIIREQGSNSDRELAYAFWLVGFDVKDIHMTDLIEGREDLSDVSVIAFVGGFSNSDVLGSAKGWAGSFLFNKKAKTSLHDFYKRKDTLSIGVCNGCQLMMELSLIQPNLKERHPKMQHNISKKFECAFVNVDILKNNSIWLQSMENTRLGIWLAHGEGRFQLEEDEKKYYIPIKYSYREFPGNTNGSDFATAALSSPDGRHLAIMPHLERSLFSWNWAYNKGLEHTNVSPWIEPFKNAFNWIQQY